MTTVKGLAVIALLVGGTSLAIAQNGPPTGGQPPIAGGAAGGPPAASTRTHVAHHPTSRHRRMYMQGDIHRGSKITGSAASTRKFLHNQNSYR
jgi:hypothetical protein